MQVDGSEKCKVSLTALDHDRPSQNTGMELLIDSGVNKTLLSEEDWRKVRPKKGEAKIKLKKCYTKFSPFGTNVKLPMLGRTKCKMTASGGASITTMVCGAGGVTVLAGPEGWQGPGHH